MKKTQHFVREVKKGSIAEELGVVPGDELVSINGQFICDVFDYHILVGSEYLEMAIRKANGEEWILEIDKEENEEMGMVFENEFMDDYRTCQNKCIFCFVDQMPKGMRETLYFKDDDARLSFLQGNYITMTNMKDADLQKIIRYHLSPINISVHTTNPVLRCEMLQNRFAGDVIMKIKKLYEAEIEMNGQIVLCKDVNDGEELFSTINDLKEYLPYFKSLSVVPVGLTKYREGLYPLAGFDKNVAREVITQVQKWQKRLHKEAGTRFVYCSDEWYIMAGIDLPDEEEYEGYPQLENGVGMVRLLETEIVEEIERYRGDAREHKISIATGKLSYQFIEKYITIIQERYPGVEVNVYPIDNNFFGNQITVTGLLTGRDIIEQLREKDLGEYLLLSVNTLRAGEKVFLDDVTTKQVSDELDIPIRIVAGSGRDFVANILLEEMDLTHEGRQVYEQSDSSNRGTTECR